MNGAWSDFKYNVLLALFQTLSVSWKWKEDQCKGKLQILVAFQWKWMTITSRGTIVSDFPAALSYFSIKQVGSDKQSSDRIPDDSLKTFFWPKLTLGKGDKHLQWSSSHFNKNQTWCFLSSRCFTSFVTKRYLSPSECSSSFKKPGGSGLKLSSIWTLLREMLCHCFEIMPPKRWKPCSLLNSVF